MPIKLNGQTSGSVQLDVPAAVSGGDVSLTLPNGTGSANQFLKNGSTAGTLEFADAALALTDLPNGTILQVKQTHINTGSSQSITSNTRAELSGLSVNITPTTSTSDMMVFVRWAGEFSSTRNYNQVFGIRRDSTDIGNPTAGGNREVGLAIIAMGYYTTNASSTPDSANWFFKDELRPSGTSQITYKATVENDTSGTLYNQRTVTDNDTSGNERLTSTIIVMEVAA